MRLQRRLPAVGRRLQWPRWRLQTVWRARGGALGSELTITPRKVMGGRAQHPLPAQARLWASTAGAVAGPVPRRSHLREGARVLWGAGPTVETRLDHPLTIPFSLGTLP